MLNLELERRKQCKTQAQLGKEADVDPCAISKAERHAYAYSGHLTRLAEALNWQGEPTDLLKEVK